MEEPGPESTSPTAEMWSKLQGDGAPLGALAPGRVFYTTSLPVPGDRTPPQRWDCGAVTGEWVTDSLTRCSWGSGLLTEQFAGAQNIHPAPAKRQPRRQEKFQDLSFALVSGFLRAGILPPVLLQTCRLDVLSKKAPEPQELHVKLFHFFPLLIRLCLCKWLEKQFLAYFRSLRASWEAYYWKIRNWKATS